MRIERRSRGSPAERHSGVGDSAFFTEWTPGAGQEEGAAHPAWTFLSGVKLPTGDELDRIRPGLVHPSLVALGTGTFDALLGARWHAHMDGLGRGGADDLSLDAGALGQLPSGQGDTGLNPANLLQVTAGAAHALGERVAVDLGMEAFFRGRDWLRSQPLPGTGSSLAFLRPGVS